MVYLVRLKINKMPEQNINEAIEDILNSLGSPKLPFYKRPLYIATISSVVAAVGMIFGSFYISYRMNVHYKEMKENYTKLEKEIGSLREEIIKYREELEKKEEVIVGLQEENTKLEKKIEEGRSFAAGLGVGGLVLGLIIGAAAVAKQRSG